MALFFAAYAKDNGLKLNLSKSRIFIQGSSVFISHINFDSLPPIVINRISLPFVEAARNLWAVIWELTSSLSRQVHVASISRKVLFHRLKFHRGDSEPCSFLLSFFRYSTPVAWFITI